MVFNSIIRGMWNKFALVLHSGIILALLGVSVWDSTLIINTFINDNRLTVVRTELASNSCRFLENITVSTASPMLPKEWFDELAAANLERWTIYSNAVSAIQNGEFLLGSINTSRVEGKIMALAVQEQLVEMDQKHMQCLIDGKESCDFEKDGNSSKLLWNVTDLEYIEKAVVSEIYNYTMGDSDDLDNASVTIHSVYDFGIGMELSIANFLEKRPTDNVYFHLRLPESADETGSIGEIYVYAARSTMSVRLENNRQYFIYLEVKNLGIHDKSETTPCTNEPEIRFSFQIHPTCDDRGFLKGIVKKCGCIPFSQKTNYRKFGDAQRLPFCDAEKYYDCSAENGPIEIAADDCLPSCITIRNQYTLETLEYPCDETKYDKCSTVSFSIQSPDHSYVVFEDRFQLTTPQFISQLGGDIGLYTGLSLLSIWQLIVFVHNRYKKYMQTTNTVLTKWGFLSELFRDSAAPLDRAHENDLEERSRKVASQGKIKNKAEVELEKRMETIENRFARMVEENSMLIARLESLTRQVGDIKRRKNN